MEPLGDSFIPRIAPPLHLVFRYGWSGEATQGWARSAGINFSPTFLASEIDLYQQFPSGRSTKIDVGAGLLTAMTHLMPYTQIGYTSPSGNGVYTTQGWLFREDRTLWVPSVAVQYAWWKSAVHLYVAGGFGSVRQPQEERVRHAIFGFTLEFRDQ